MTGAKRNVAITTVMGKHTHTAASVSWEDVKTAISANPHCAHRLQKGSASCSVSVLPADTEVPWLPGWSEDATFTVTDPVSFSLWVREPMYRVAAHPIRRSMEMEEAAHLLHTSELAWKQHNGRARGWTRKHLEEDLRARAGGADPLPDAWEAIRTKKRSALLLDYICVVRKMRVALWWPDFKAVTVIPLSGSVAPSVVQLNCLSGRIMLGPTSEFQVACASWPAIAAAAVDITWVPPVSAPSIGSHTVAQIHDRIQNILHAENYVRAGARAAVWNRLMWHTLESSLNGKEVVTEDV